MPCNTPAGRSARRALLRVVDAARRRIFSDRIPLNYDQVNQVRKGLKRYKSSAYLHLYDIAHWTLQLSVVFVRF